MITRAARLAKSHLIRFHRSAPAILVFGLRRGGSTMVADAVAANAGVWYSNEPFAVFPNRPGYQKRKSWLPHAKHSHFFDLGDQDLSRFSKFSEKLLRADIPEMGTARRTLPLLKANRVSLKILNAPWMIDWFAAETDSHILSVIRHPGAQARSVLRQGWQFPVEAYLERPGFVQKHFSADQIAFATDLMREGSDWERAILDWVITSHPLRSSHNSAVRKLKYENIVEDPKKFIQGTLQDRCSLSDEESMLKAILRPSGSSHLNTTAATKSIEDRNVDQIVNGWRRKTSKDELQSGQSILDKFEVEEYRFV